MAQRRIVRAFATTIPVSVLEKIEDITKCKDISANTQIRACIQSLTLERTAGEIVVDSGPRGEFTILLSAAQTTLLVDGKDTIDGQIEFGTTQNPITFQIAVKVEGAPC